MNSGQGKTDTIPKLKNKSKSKIKPLQEEIFNLKTYNEDLLEEMYKAGIRTRPTIMSQIEEKEASVLSMIEFSIAECEKETGRPFPFYLGDKSVRQYAKCSHPYFFTDFGDIKP